MSSLSEDEFNRMQAQLLELREKNYKLEDAGRRHEKDISMLHDQAAQLHGELDKTNKILAKSKKAKEVEALMQENELLQRKLTNQEEDFRLQNETLMKELTQLVNTNEILENEIKSFKVCSEGEVAEGTLNPCISSSTLSPASFALQDDLRRLQAQNSVMQDTLTVSQSSHAIEVASLKQIISELEGQCIRLSGKRGAPVGGSATREGDIVDGSETDIINEEYRLHDDDDTGESKSVSMRVSSFSSSHSIDQRKLINELQLSLNVEQEEKRLLRQELVRAQSCQKQDLVAVQDLVNTLTEKLKKKQESFLQLQEEKEQLFKELTDRLAKVEADKELELSVLRQQIGRLNQDIYNSSQSEDQLSRCRARIVELEGQVSGLEKRIDCLNSEATLQMAQAAERTTETVKELEQRIQEQSDLVENLQTQLQECQSAHASSVDEIGGLLADLEKQRQAVVDANKVAEKRKCLLDELAIKYQQEIDQHREQTKSLNDRINVQSEELVIVVHQLKLKTEDAEQVETQLTQQRAQLTNLETARNYLDRRIKEAETTLEETRHDNERSMEELKVAQSLENEKLKTEHQEQKQLLESEVAELKSTVTTLNEKIVRLQQEIKDGIDDKKLHEKKGATVLKDLKRQFQAEKKRADKLQDKLQELLSDSRSRQSVEDLFRPIDNSDRQKSLDGSSVCSWSPSAISRENVLAQTPEEATVIRQENEELMKKVADLQEEKSTLEEKVAHLESSNSSMADDLLEKTAIIEHYIMDSRAGDHVASPVTSERMSLKRVVDFMKVDRIGGNGGGAEERDMNKRLQRMLEETLTKNMHLQQDLEKMSKEIEIRKNPSSSTDSTPAKQSSLLAQPS